MLDVDLDNGSRARWVLEWSSVAAAAAAAAHDCLLVLVIAAGERVSLAAIQAPVRQAVAR